jgi:hypothetical protein
VRADDDGEVSERRSTQAELVVVSVGSEDDWTRRSMEGCSRWKKQRRGVACCRLRAAANGSGRRPKLRWCLRRSPWRSPTGGGWRRIAWRCSVAVRQSKA